VVYNLKNKANPAEACKVRIKTLVFFMPADLFIRITFLFLYVRNVYARSICFLLHTLDDCSIWGICMFSRLPVSFDHRLVSAGHRLASATGRHEPADRRLKRSEYKPEYIYVIKLSIF
jgi:hypothetical protein